jgi:hypothetical protein
MTELDGIMRPCAINCLIAVAALLSYGAAAAEAQLDSRFGEVLRTDSFKYHVWTNWAARTNGRTPQITRSITEIPGTAGTQANDALWNTNWYFYGTENFTAMTHVKTNLGGDVWWTKKAAVISPVALLQSGHAYCGNNPQHTACGSNGWYLAVDATNGQHWRRAVGGISRQESLGPWGITPWSRADYMLVVLEKPLPASIASLPIVPLDELARVVDLATINWPSHVACQHSSTADNASFRGTGHAPIGGDSGSPTFFVMSNRLVIGVNGLTSPIFCGSATNASGKTPWEQFMTDYTNLLKQAGHAPSQFPLRIQSMAGFPELR